jgi:energy-coupling factor transporter ATP-binding protein EcfA2
LRFLTAIRINDFRSVADAALDQIGDITPVVGLNGSGKSNLMRALNLLFTGNVEGTEGIDLRRDFREPGRKAKRRVAVEVDLDFGIFDSLRSEYTDALDALAAGSPQVTIRKEWTLDPATRETVTTVMACAAGEAPTTVRPEQGPLAQRLLSAVRFRYISNHVHPSRILQHEEEEIRRMLFDRLGKRQILQDRVVASIGTVAGELMRPVAEVMQTATGEVATVELTTPADWRELVWAFGMQLRGPQTQPFDALLHGSGVQSVLAYSILHAIDTSFSGSFGWRKGAIWAVEEPESFLHAGLQEELGRLLVEYSTDEPLQTVFSTHATPFLGVAEEGFVASLDEAGHTEFKRAARTELLQNAYTARIAPYAHALHTGPPKALLLVEGKSDRDLLLRAYQESGMANPYDIRALSDLDERLQGGDELPRWLRYNAAALRARPETSPVFVLRDWESRENIMNQIETALEPHRTSRCFAWPKDLTNQDLSDNFTGIEKFLSTDFIEHAARQLGLQLLAPVPPHEPAWRFDVNKRSFEERKHAVHEELAQRANTDDLLPLKQALSWLSGQLAATPPML